MNYQSFPLINVALVLFAGWASSDLFRSWLMAPYERYAWIVFLIWLLPIFCYLVLALFTKQKFFFTSVWIPTMALLLTLLGSIGSINTLCYAGLAFALGSLMPWQTSLLFWLFCSISWMPLFGWIGSHYLETYTLAIRIFLASLGTITACLILLSPKQRNHHE